MMSFAKNCMRLMVLLSIFMAQLSYANRIPSGPTPTGQDHAKIALEIGMACDKYLKDNGCINQDNKSCRAIDSTWIPYTKSVVIACSKKGPDHYFNNTNWKSKSCSCSLDSARKSVRDSNKKKCLDAPVTSYCKRTGTPSFDYAANKCDMKLTHTSTQYLRACAYSKSTWLQNNIKAIPGFKGNWYRKTSVS